MPSKINNNKKPKSGKQRRQNAVSLPRVTTAPNSKRILMSYAVGGAGSESAAGSGLFWFYRLNSVYDPDASGVGSSAGGYNTWSALFLNYKVHRVTVRVQGTAVCANGAMVQVITAPIPGQAVGPSNPHYWRLIPDAKVITLAPNANGGKTTFESVQSFDLAKVARVTKQQYQNDMDYSGAVGSNPARQIYWMLGAQSINSGTVGTLVNCIQITYEVEWFNPVPMQA
jgi:hypothetical protein